MNICIFSADREDGKEARVYLDRRGDSSCADLELHEYHLRQNWYL